MKVGFFEEAEGKKSSARLLTFIAGVSGVVIALASTFMSNVTLGDSMPMVMTLLSYAAGVKVFQKALESKK